MKFNYWQDFEEGKIYHIYNRAVSNELLFRNDKDYVSFLNKFNKYFGNYFSVFAYCLIPNHFHILVQVKSLSEILFSLKNESSKASELLKSQKSNINSFLIDQLRRFFSSISLSYNNKYQRRGPLLSPRSKRVLVNGENKLIYLISYIHHNPIHHGLCSDYSTWKYSSYKAYCNDLNSKIAKKEILDWIGGIEIFEEIHFMFRIDYFDNMNLD